MTSSDDSAIGHCGSCGGAVRTSDSHGAARRVVSDARIRDYAAGVVERDAVVRREIAESYRERERFAEVRPADAVGDSLWDSGDADGIPF